ncbi:hypothetical protein Zmor_002273 [Zophobas morio]|uniref:Uncharacterized protein n=1 Tax=Zophobas morio TaxID=2755281 RepID=A0AA38J4D3_9CUCU|nr:hypothetical protein Zmor_002273 [Zophobas morio]
MLRNTHTPPQYDAYGLWVTEFSGIYGDNGSSWMTSPRADYRKSRLRRPEKHSKRHPLKKGLETEVAMDSRKTSIGKHREGNTSLNRGHRQERIIIESHHDSSEVSKSLWGSPVIVGGFATNFTQSIR